LYARSRANTTDHRQTHHGLVDGQRLPIRAISVRNILADATDKNNR